MNNSEAEFRIIPIDKILVVNPRTRNKIVCADIIKDVSGVGLKKPITVSQREGSNGDPTYDLVCGQGRLEAFVASGAKEIPAFVISASKEEILLMALIAPRFPNA